MASGTWRAPGMIDRAGERVSASQTEDNLLENLLLTVWYNWHSCQTSQYPFDPHAWLISHFKEWQSAATVRSEGPFLFLRVFDLPSFTSKIPKFLAIVAMVREESTVSQQGTVPISSRIDSKCSRIGWSRCWGACQIQFGMAIDLDRSNPQKTFFAAQHTVPILPARPNHDQQRTTNEDTRKIKLSNHQTHSWCLHLVGSSLSWNSTTTTLEVDILNHRILTCGFKQRFQYGFN